MGKPSTSGGFGCAPPLALGHVELQARTHERRRNQADDREVRPPRYAPFARARSSGLQRFAEDLVALSADDALVPHVGGGKSLEADVAKDATLALEARFRFRRLEAALERAPLDAELYGLARDVLLREIDGREQEVGERVGLAARLGADGGERRAACVRVAPQRHVEPHEVHAVPIRL